MPDAGLEQSIPISSDLSGGLGRGQVLGIAGSDYDSNAGRATRLDNDVVRPPAATGIARSSVFCWAFAEPPVCGRWVGRHGRLAKGISRQNLPPVARDF